MIAKLTELEYIDLVEHLNSGKSYRQIANAMFLSFSGANSRIVKLYRELGVNNRTEAIKEAKKLGWLINNEDSQTTR